MTEQKKPAVSVIVPVYGVEGYLDRCVESILGQSFRDFEVILVDDGSPDRCPAICDAWGKKDPRVKVIHRKNGGVSSARNAGLEAAAGKWITFCDSDDSWEPQWLERLTEAAGPGTDVVAAGHRKCFEDGHTEIADHETGTFSLDTQEQRLRYCIDYVLTDRHAWEIWSRLFRGSILRDNGLRFCESCGNFAEDLGFVLNYSLYTRQVVCIPETGYRYTVRGNSMMGSSAGKPKLDSVNEISMDFQDRLKTAVSPELREQYGPVLHFLVMMVQYSVVICRDNYHNIGTYLDTIRRRDRWETLTRGIFNCRGTLEDLFGKIPAGRIRIYSRYCLHRCWFRFKVERFLFFKRNGYRD